MRVVHQDPPALDPGPAPRGPHGIGLATSFIASLVWLSACATETPTLTCESTEDCPASQSCLQGSCLALELPDVRVLSPEHELPIAYVDGTTPHTVTLVISGVNLVLRSLADSSEAVPGEGHLVVFVDEMEVGKIDSGDLESDIQMDVQIPDVPGAHFIRVQARLNDGSDYDNEHGAARVVVWVDDGRQHVTFMLPWPHATFTLDEQLTEGKALGFNGVMLGTPSSGLLHVHVFYDEAFPACFDDPPCMTGYVGILPNDQDPLGPMLLPAAAAGVATLTAVVMNPDYTLYLDELGEPVWSSIEIVRANATENGSLPASGLPAVATDEAFMPHGPRVRRGPATQ